MKRIVRRALAVGIAAVFLAGPVRAEETLQIDDQPVAGQIFGVAVSMDNYLFAKSAAAIFSGTYGREVKTSADLEDRTWEDLVLSYEAFRRGVSVSPERFEKEMDALLKAEKVSFDWKKDRSAFDAWVKDRVKEPAVLFENQLKHLLQLQLLREQVREAFEPEATEAEALQKYKNEYNSLELDLAKFDDEAAAQAFYQEAVKSPKAWDKRLKKEPKFSLKTGFVSFEWLIDAWKIPKDDCAAMLKMPVNAVYKPTPIYKGFAVFRILQKREAVAADFPAKKDEYLKRVKMVKRYQMLQEWLVAIKKQAVITPFVKPGQVGVAPATATAAASGEGA
jgi:hypothetical protein